MSTPALALISSGAISSLLWTASQVPPAWGVFDSNNNQPIIPDSILEFSYRKAFSLPTFPVQQGQFADYNKVSQPAEIRLRMVKVGSVQDRTTFLLQYKALLQSIALYNIIVPEGSYDGFNCSRGEIVRRGAQGAFMLTEVDLFFTEIAEISPQYTNTGVYLPDAQSTSAQPVANQGNVLPQAPSSAYAAAASNGINSAIVGGGFSW